MSKHYGTLLDYFWEHIEKLPSDCERVNKEKLQTGCWRWSGAPDSGGYGKIWKKEAYGKSAHTFLYETFIGPIPDGQELDHLCRNRWCCNPDHLEAVPHQENAHRGVGWPGQNAQKTYCRKGHPLEGDNLHIEKSGSRRCRRCRTDAKQRWTERHVERTLERYHRYKLSAYNESLIRHLWESGEFTQKDLARAFDASRSLVNNIVNAKRPSDTLTIRRTSVRR